MSVLLAFLRNTDKIVSMWGIICRNRIGCRTDFGAESSHGNNHERQRDGVEAACVFANYNKNGGNSADTGSVVQVVFTARNLGSRRDVYRARVGVAYYIFKTKEDGQK